MTDTRASKRQRRTGLGLLLILACAKQVIRSDRAVRQGPWGWRNKLEQGEVAGKSLLKC